MKPFRHLLLPLFSLSIFLLAFSFVSAASTEDEIEGACNHAYWADIKIWRAYRCNENFSYNGHAVNEWMQQREIARAFSTGPCIAWDNGQISQDDMVREMNVYQAASKPFNDELITCVCKDPKCDNFYYGFCWVLTNDKGETNCGQNTCIEHGYGCGGEGGAKGTKEIIIPGTDYGPTGSLTLSVIESIGKAITTSYSLPVPSQFESIPAFLDAVARFILNLAIPVAVILIILSGVILLTSGGNQERVALGRRLLRYTLIGLVIVLIGRGFVALIKSILEL